MGMDVNRYSLNVNRFIPDRVLSALIVTNNDSRFTNNGFSNSLHNRRR
jgi:hypothetical protein